MQGNRQRFPYYKSNVQKYQNFLNRPRYIISRSLVIPLATDTLTITGLPHEVSVQLNQTINHNKAHGKISVTFMAKRTNILVINVVLRSDYNISINLLYDDTSQCLKTVLYNFKPTV